MYPTVVFKSFLSDLMGKEGPENAQVIAPNVFDYINLGPTPSFNFFSPKLREKLS